MINKLCGAVGCNRLAVKGKYFCAEHQKQSDERKAKRDKDFSRLAKASRAFDYSNPEWLKLKRRMLKEHPYCCYCGSTDNLQVHHIKPVRFHPELILEESNLMVLCRQCHFAVTKKEMQQRKR